MSSNSQESEKLISGSSSILANLVFSKIGLENNCNTTNFSSQDFTDNYIPMNDFTKSLIENSFKLIILKLLSLKIDIQTVIKSVILFERSLLKNSHLISISNFKEYFLICLILKIKYQISMDVDKLNSKNTTNGNCLKDKYLKNSIKRNKNNSDLINSINTKFYNFDLNDSQLENEILITLNYVCKINNNEVEFYKNFFLMMSDFEAINNKDSANTYYDSSIKLNSNVNNHENLIKQNQNDSQITNLNNISFNFMKNNQDNWINKFCDEQIDNQYINKNSNQKIELIECNTNFNYLIHNDNNNNLFPDFNNIIKPSKNNE